MLKLKVAGQGKDIVLDVEESANLYDVLVAKQMISDAPCGGTGKCGKCKVEMADPVPEATENEIRRLTSGEISAGTRLACEITLLQDTTIRLVQDQSDQVTLLAVDETVQYGEIYAAFDIGTTTIETVLVDAATGSELAAAAAKNPQAAFGADVFTRMSFAMESEENLRILSGALSGVMNRLLSAMADALGADAKDITKAAVSGNTTMLHMLLNLDIRPLAAAPFVTEHLSPGDLTGKDIRLLCDHAQVCFSPAASAFLGGDAVLGAAVLGIGSPGITALLIDLGTNGEMVLAKDGKFTGCSVAAGPAFEGAEMVCGMRAVKGAVTDAWVEEDLAYRTIEDVCPVGICGSGYISLIAEMVENGVISENGKLVPNSKKDKLNARVETLGEKPKFIVSKDEDIGVYQSDIRSFQLAKSAVRSGVEMLLEKHALKPADLDVIYIAGGFGSNIKSGDLFRCGALPFVHPNIKIVGNTSLQGAVRMVTDTAFKQQVLAFSKKIEVFLLSTQSSFQDRFINNLLFT